MKSDVYDNRQDTDTTWVSTGGWVGKEEVVCSTQRSPSRPQGKKEPCSLPQNRWAERALCEVRQARQRKTKLSRCLLHVESQTQTWNNPGSQIRKTAHGWGRQLGGTRWRRPRGANVQGDIKQPGCDTQHRDNGQGHRLTPLSARRAPALLATLRHDTPRSDHCVHTRHKALWAEYTSTKKGRKHMPAETCIQLPVGALFITLTNSEEPSESSTRKG